jgi:hypothetical protein
VFQNRNGFASCWVMHAYAGVAPLIRGMFHLTTALVFPAVRWNDSVRCDKP